MTGKLLIFSGPSGSGKSTIVQHLVGLDMDLAFSISATSREPRKGEVNGRQYHFISAESFRQKIEQNEFIEWEEVYPGQYYGTLHSEVERIWALGKNALFDIDVMGGLNLKRAYGGKALSVFVMPPSLEELDRRLRLRGTDSEEALNKRLGKAGQEMQFSSEFDHVLVNHNLHEALSEAESVARQFLAS